MRSLLYLFPLHWSEFIFAPVGWWLCPVSWYQCPHHHSTRLPPPVSSSTPESPQVVTTGRWTEPVFSRWSLWPVYVCTPPCQPANQVLSRLLPFVSETTPGTSWNIRYYKTVYISKLLFMGIYSNWWKWPNSICDLWWRFCEESCQERWGQWGGGGGVSSSSGSSWSRPQKLMDRKA